MRISDWSSDVCSSDLRRRAGAVRQLPCTARAEDPASADEGALRECAGAGWIPGIAPGDRRSDLSGPGIASAPRAGEAPDGRLRRHALDSPQGRLRGREALLRAHRAVHVRSEDHTSELQSLMRISYAVFCLKKKKTQ